MGYRNVREVLPDDLIKKIQEYIDGESIYIPKKEIRSVNLKQDNSVRDREIFEKYQKGCKVTNLAEEYYISTQGIYKIIAKQRRK